MHTILSKVLSQNVLSGIIGSGQLVEKLIAVIGSKNLTIEIPGLNVGVSQLADFCRRPVTTDLEREIRIFCF